SVLGRRLRWAFDAPQLLVVPRAGEWANAYYERETHSLQFFFFAATHGRGMVYTSLSRDIVSHETAHAILDGIAPDLYDALTPQSLALHEAFADLTALIMAIRSHTLARTVLEQTKGRLEEYTTAFSRIAGQFGWERHGGHSLRDLSKTVRMDQVASVEPHELSTVLSSALYEMLIKIFEAHRTRLAEKEGAGFADPEFSKSGEALVLSARQLARMIFRALDYLPPGEITFADYGRAILAADKTAYPHAGRYREFLRDAFVKRQIVPNGAALNIETNFEIPLARPVDLEDLVDSDWVAYEFANQQRDLLRIPKSVEAFRVHRRLKTEKRFNQGGAKVQDIVFRVSWDHIEENGVGRGLPASRRVTAGTTLVINADGSQDAEVGLGGGAVEMVQGPVTKMEQAQTFGFDRRRRQLRTVRGGKETLLIRARLTSDLGESQRQARDEMLDHLMTEGLVEIDEHAVGPDGKLRSTVVHAQTRQGVLKLGGTARMLHIATR
ncbi:MAG TPA: hypothetical protein VM537_01235, partial [Anaerolineae bacterium]|nr:hypothetical protein [Anaerolineae bacterium]